MIRYLFMIPDIITVWRAWVEIHKEHAAALSYGQLFEVFRRYGEKHRFYHTLAHIAACLRFLDAMYPKIGATSRNAIRMAIIYHDIIYDVKSKTNEDESAEYARRQMIVMGFDREFYAEVVRLILLTKNHKGDPKDRSGSIMIDVDMHVFCQPTEVYIKYARDIRSEYEPAFGAEPFKAGRLHFLSTVDPQAIFVTPEMTGELVVSMSEWNIHEERRILTGGHPG